MKWRHDAEKIIIAQLILEQSMAVMGNPDLEVGLAVTSSRHRLAAAHVTSLA